MAYLTETQRKAQLPVPLMHPALAQFEQGHRLLQTLQTRGWQDIESILNEIADGAAEQVRSFNPIGQQGDTAMQLFWLQSRARAMKELIEILRAAITEHINQAKEVANNPTGGDSFGLGELA